MVEYILTLFTVEIDRKLELELENKKTAFAAKYASNCYH